MDLDTRLKVLEELYRIYDEFAGTLDVACRKHCATCCTDKVVVTTLEGYRMISGLEDDLRSQFFETLHQGLSPTRFKPRLTTNRLAELCMKDEDLPEDEMDSDGGACAFLVDDACPLYANRPFACRCMLSTTDCNKTGYAEMDAFVVTVNNVFLQYIEHIDAGGCSGNLTDVLIVLASEENRQLYRENQLACPAFSLVANQSIPALMIPPNHREKIEPILKAIQGIRVN